MYTVIYTEGAGHIVQRVINGFDTYEAAEAFVREAGFDQTHFMRGVITHYGKRENWGMTWAQITNEVCDVRED